MFCMMFTLRCHFSTNSQTMMVAMAASPRQKARNEFVGAMEERLTRMRGVPPFIRLQYFTHSTQKT